MSHCIICHTQRNQALNLGVFSEVYKFWFERFMSDAFHLSSNFNFRVAVHIFMMLGVEIPALLST